MPKCRYCDHWKFSSKRKKEDPSIRFCGIKQKWTGKEEEVCGYSTNEFKMSDFFWCDFYMHYKPTLGCIKNQEIETSDECRFCRQGEEVSVSYECYQEKLIRRKIKLIRRKTS